MPEQRHKMSKTSLNIVRIISNFDGQPRMSTLTFLLKKYWHVMCHTRGYLKSEMELCLVRLWALADRSRAINKNLFFILQKYLESESVIKNGGFCLEKRSWAALGLLFPLDKLKIRRLNAGLKNTEHVLRFSRSLI